MKTIKQLEKQLAVLRDDYLRTIDPDMKAELEEKIDSIQDDIDELEEAERDSDDWEEMTGTRPQDLYDERNSYAVRQSEMIDRFRSEY